MTDDPTILFIENQSLPGQCRAQLIFLALLFIWPANFVCYHLKLVPEIVLMCLCIAILSGCALQLESEQIFSIEQISCSCTGCWFKSSALADILFLYRLLIQICCSSWLRTLLRACSCCNNDVDMWTATLKLSTEQCPHDWGSYLLLTAISSNSWQGGVCGSPCHRQSRPQTLIEPRHYRFTEVKSESFVMMRRQNWTKASLCVNWAGLTC